MGDALRLGLILPPQDPNLSVRQLVDLAVLAEAEGYAAVFTPEAFAYDAHCVMTACAPAA